MKNINDILKKNLKNNPETKIIKDSPDEELPKLMYSIDRPEPTKFFLDVRQIVGCLLQKQINNLDGAHWLKTDLTYPSFEHLSIAYKNQIFCILIEIIDKNTDESFLPTQYKKNLIENCIKNNLVPCLYKIYVDNPLDPAYNSIRPKTNGWNLYSAVTDLPVSIEEIATDTPIEMSTWELNDFAIQVVRDIIKKENKYQITSYQSVENIDPQIWIQDESGELMWIIVRHVIYPENEACIPDNINSIKLSCHGYKGFFASVGFYSADNPNPEKLYRGNGVYVRFTGLQEIE